jgi:ATP-dependent Zn protease
LDYGKSLFETRSTRYASQQSLYQTQRHVRHAERRQQYMNQQQHDQQHNKLDETAEDFASSSSFSDGFSSTSTPSYIGDGLSSSTLSSTYQQQPQIVYRLAVGTVDAFEKKLEEAQHAVHMDPTHEIPVQYTADSSLTREVLRVIPSLLFMGAAFLFMRYATGSLMGGGGFGGGGGMGGIFQIGKSTAKKINKEDVTINFSNVAGCDEAKKEVMECVDFLQDPTRFTKLGAKIPQGAL